MIVHYPRKLGTRESEQTANNVSRFIISAAIAVIIKW
jgi:hypothetical protein